MSLDLRNVWTEIVRNNLRKFRHVYYERLHRTSHPRWNFLAIPADWDERERERFFVFVSRDVTIDKTKFGYDWISRKKEKWKIVSGKNRTTYSDICALDIVSFDISKYATRSGQKIDQSSRVGQSRLFNPRLISCCTRNIVGRSIHISNPTRSLGPGLVNSI